MAISAASVRAIAASPATNLPLMISSRWIGWDTSRGSVLGALAIDRVEPEGDAEQRTEDAEELVERRHPFGRQGEQVQVDRRRLRRGVRRVTDRTARRVHRRQPGEGEQHEQDDEANRGDVVGELLAGDDAPAAAEPPWPFAAAAPT